MSETPWLTIIGLGEDGPDGLPPASRTELEAAEIVMGPPRHLSLLPALRAELLEWPVPFADGISRLLTLRGRQVVVLASGDPFWFGAGTVIGKHLERHEWQALPGPSCFSLAAARMGWGLEGVICLGLHGGPHDPPASTSRDGTTVDCNAARWCRVSGTRRIYFGPRL